MVKKLETRLMANEDKASVMQIIWATPEFTPAEVVVAEEVIDSYLRDPSGSGYHVFVAVGDSAVVGYICYGSAPLTEGTWDIYWMAVAPGEKGRGIGKALLALAEFKIKEAHGRLSIIETSSKPEYDRTRRFHRSQGYDVACRIADFYAPGDDKVIFQKRLT